MSHPAEDVRDAGSLIVEAAVGIGLLAMIVASIATAIPAVLDARDRAVAHHELLHHAEEVLERVLARTDPPLDGDLIEVAIVHRAAVVDSCSARVVAASRGFDVRAKDTGRVGSREVQLRDGIRMTDEWFEADAPKPIRVHRPAHVGAQLVATSSDRIDPLIDGDGGSCLWLIPAAAGRYEIGPEDPSSDLIGPTHLLLRDHPVAITVDGRPVDRDLDLASAARLTVHADPAGARFPDLVSTGSLVWTVRGDDARVSTDLGNERAVRDGDITVVVSACRNGEAVGSSTSLSLDPGEVRSTIVPLATVTLTNIGTRNNWTLNALRFTECSDGSTRRPSLSWSGGLHDGMRIALPRGLWQLSLTTPGRPVSPRVLAPAGDPDLVVVMR